LSIKFVVGGEIAMNQIARFCVHAIAPGLLAAVSLSPLPASASAIVYSNDFSSAENALPTSADGFLSGPGLVYQIQIAPDDTTFLGFLNQTAPFPNNTKAAVLPLSGLAPHTSVTISFDLYALFYLSGDGAHDNSGGTYFKLIAADSLHDLAYQPTVIFNESFSSGVCDGCASGQPFQSYGGPGLSGVYPGTTGSFSHDPTGFGWCQVYGAACGGGSAGEFTYKMNFTLDDVSDFLALGFIGNALSTDFGTITSVGFGIDNLVVTANTTTDVLEPSSLSLFLGGLGLVGLVGQRRRSKVKACGKVSI
jgi:hypothetical protein